MGATSSTGTGLGQSFGEYKPETSSGCCGKARPEETPSSPPKKYCSAKVKSGNKVRYRSGFSSGKIKGC